jgi:hypothetical protein
MQLEEETLLNIWLTGTSNWTRLETLTSEMQMQSKVGRSMPRKRLWFLKVLQECFAPEDLHKKIASGWIDIRYNNKI